MSVGKKSRQPNNSKTAGKRQSKKKSQFTLSCRFLEKGGIEVDQRMMMSENQSN
jgi:hypothetical protein